MEFLRLDRSWWGQPIDYNVIGGYAARGVLGRVVDNAHSLIRLSVPGGERLIANVSSERRIPMEALLETSRLRDGAADAAERITKTLDATRTAVSERLEEGKLAAKRLMRRSRHAAEELLDDASHQIRHYPLRSVAVAFAAGALVGILVPRIAKK